MHQIHHNGQTITYDVEKRKKKNISIRIKPDGKVLVTAPLFVSERDIEKVMESKAGWIWNKLQQVRSLIESVIERKYVSGEKFLYFGEEFELEIIKDDKAKIAKVRVHTGKLEIRICASKADNTDEIKRELYKWYRKEAELNIVESVELYAERLGLRPKLVKTRELKSSWGLCSSNGNVSLSWKLIMAPIEVMDYVVIHELCHRRHHNHSKDFWNLVGEYEPDYRERRKWLKMNGCRMEL